MSATFRPRHDVPMTVRAFDGTFDDITPPAARREPYLHISGPNSFALALSVTTEQQLSGLITEVDRLATYFASWQESQQTQEEGAA